MSFKRVPSKKKMTRFEKEAEDMPGAGDFSPMDVANKMREDRREGKGPQKNKKGKGPY